MNNEDEEEAYQSAETSISTFKAHPQIVKAKTVDSVSGWSNSLRRKTKKMNRIFHRPRSDDFEKRTRPESLVSNDSGIELASCELEQYNRIARNVELKEIKLQELLMTEESYMNDLEAIDRIRIAAIQSKEKKLEPHMPKQLSEGRDKIIFKNVLKIVNFHRKYFTVAIREAEGCSAKILNLFQSKHEEMKTFYGKFCIDFKKAEYLIKNFSEYIVELEKIAETEIHLQDLFLRIVSRLPAYQLFFKEISEICENAHQSDDAFLFDSCRRISFEINKVADVLMDVAENIENFDDDVTELGDLLYHEELQYRKYKIRTSTFSTLAFRRTMSREPTYPCYIFLFSKYLMICRLRLRGSANLDEKKKYFLEKKFSLLEMEADDAPGGSEKEFMVIDTHNDPFDSIPKARKDDLILVANCKEQKERWMQKIGDEIRKKEDIASLLMNPSRASLNDDDDEL